MAQTHYRQVLGHATRVVPEHGHERATHAWVCREVAHLLGVPDAGVAGDGVIEVGTFHVPDDTLTTAQARGLGIHGVGDLLGGIVPHAFRPPRSSVTHWFLTTRQALRAGTRRWPCR